MAVPRFVGERLRVRAMTNWMGRGGAGLGGGLGLLLILAGAWPSAAQDRPLESMPLPPSYQPLALAYVVRPDWLLALPFAPRLVIACLLAFLPIYLANIAFAKRFAESGDSRAAFAVNILGAIVGGCLEYAALVTGYANLLLVVAGLYLLAFLLKPRASGGLPA